MRIFRRSSAHMRLASLESKCRVHRLLRVGRTRPR